MSRAIEPPATAASPVCLPSTLQCQPLLKQRSDSRVRTCDVASPVESGWLVGSTVHVAHSVIAAGKSQGVITATKKDVVAAVQHEAGND